MTICFGMFTRRVGCAVALAGLTLATPAAFAQRSCPPGWQPGGGVPGVNSIVETSAIFDPDGAGPQSPALVLGGGFTQAGPVSANFIAIWNPTINTWATLGSGMNGAVYSLAVMPNGDLIAGGNFTTAGGTAANRVARWSITTNSWSPMSSGMNDLVLALAVQPGGDLTAGAPSASPAGFLHPSLLDGTQPLRAAQALGSPSDRGWTATSTRWPSCPTAT